MNSSRNIAMLGVVAFTTLTLSGCGNATMGVSPTSQNPTSTHTTTNTIKDINTTVPTTSTSKGNATGETGTITGDTKIIRLVSPTANQTVKASSKIAVAGTVAKGFENQTLQVTLFSGTNKVSNTLQIQKFKVDGNGKFSGTFTIPSKLAANGTRMSLICELLVKGGPMIQTTLTAQ